MLYLRNLLHRLINGSLKNNANYVPIIKHLLLVVLSVVSSFAGAFEHKLAAQRNIVFDRLGTDKGLSQALVSVVAQDQHGFIWVGTQEGLNRYDGRSFHHFYHVAGEPESLSHDSIRSLFTDSAGQLWVGTDEGLNRYLPYRETFQILSLTNGVDEAEYAVFDIEEDSFGTLWIATSVGLYSKSKKDKVSSHSIANGSLGKISSLSLSQNPNVLWLGTELNGLYKLDIPTGEFVAMRTAGNGEPIVDDLELRDVIEDSSGNIWLGSFSGGLSKYNVSADHVEKYKADSSNSKSLASNRIRSLFEDRDGNIWVGTDGGLHLWNTDRGFTRFVHDLTNPRSISDNTIHDIYQDRGGVIWLGTFDGLNKWNADVENFPLFRRPVRENGVTPTNNVTSFTEDASGDVWIGTFSGLLKWDSTKGELSTVTNPDIVLDDQRVMSLGHYDGEVWVGTMTAGISVIRDDKTTHRFTELSGPESISSNAITSFYNDSKGRLWITTWGGGVNLYLGDNKFRKFPSRTQLDSFSDLRCLAILEVSEDEFWIATDGGGIVVLNPNTGETNEIRHNLKDRETSLVSDNLITLLRTMSGVWVGSVDRGLSFYDFETRKFTSFTKQEGLVSDAIYGLLEDSSSRIWISSAKGLTVYDTNTGHFSSFDTTHGLQSSDFNSGAYAKFADGSLAFGGISGFNVFYPSSIRRNSYTPSVLITEFKLFNKTHDLGAAIHEVESVELQHSDSVISIGFAAFDFSAPEKNRYQYKLFGFDKNWVLHEGSPEVTYTNLDAGEYVFKVRGSNNDGVWNPIGASLAIVVNPAPWLAWWAYLIYASIGLFAVFAMFRFNGARLQREAERRYSERLQLYIESLEEASDSILIADSSGTLIYANNTIIKGLNKTPQEVVGESVWDVLFHNSSDMDNAREILELEGRFHGEVTFAPDVDSDIVHEVTIAAVQQASSSKLAYVGISRDISDRKVAEAQLEDYRKNLEKLVQERTEALQKEIAENKAIQVDLAESLQEKELLIKEVHHRVKNNMQVISSLLSIQAEGAGDEIYSNLLNESQQRIKSMALIHETLYQSKDLLKIDFQDYIETLTTSLSRSYSVPGVSVHVDVHVDNVLLDLETAVPCGLVINELVSNSLKHAFHGKEGIGMIDIDFVINDCHYDLRIADNGVGLPDDFDPTKNVSMGMEIVSILTSQLEGNLTARSDGGAIFEIKFPRTVNA